MSSFKDLRIVDNFYQTSSFFPMPTMLIGTLDDDGNTTLGTYSLCFPYYIAGKSYYAMLLECRNSSNTAQNLLKRGKCSLNFITDEKKYFAEAVRLGFPGETSKEKMAKCKFTFENGLAESDKNLPRPQVVKEAFQVFECSWDSSLENAFEDSERVGQLEGIEPPYRNFNGITSKFGCHFILKIDKILLKEKFHEAIINGVKANNFPSVPVDYGYRDSTNFWYTKFTKPKKAGVPEKPLDITGAKYAAERIDPEVTFSDDAILKIAKIPRVFLKLALNGIVEIAKTMNLPKTDGKIIIDATIMDKINDKRKEEKDKK